ncbi:hypothetical protein Tco_0579100 [Tanacetum coccineum]
MRIEGGVLGKDLTVEDYAKGCYTGAVRGKHGMNEPEDEFEKVLWEYLKNMFEEPLSTDSIWSLPGQQRIICWRYYDACRVDEYSCCKDQKEMICKNLQLKKNIESSVYKLPQKAQIGKTLEENLMFTKVKIKLGEDC